ncbi:hypothetical protein HHI36_019134, partial [Cryptolaemus montrouzieri]
NAQEKNCFTRTNATDKQISILGNGRSYIRNRKFIRPCKNFNNFNQDSKQNVSNFQKPLSLTRTRNNFFVPIVENDCEGINNPNVTLREDASSEHLKDRDDITDSSDESFFGNIEDEIDLNEESLKPHDSVGSEGEENSPVKKAKVDIQSGLQDLNEKGEKCLIPHGFVVRTGRQIKRPVRFSGTDIQTLQNVK